LHCLALSSCCFCRCFCHDLQRALQAARGAAKPLLTTLLTAVGELFTATQQAACLDVLSTIAEVFGEVKNAPELAAAQKQAFEGGLLAQGMAGACSSLCCTC
jgi:hypothetical protein